MPTQLKPGDLVIRTARRHSGQPGAGTVREVYPSGRVEVYWPQSRQCSTLAGSALRITTDEQEQERRAASKARNMAETGHWKYCALHHHRLNGNGTCMDCRTFPVSIYTKADATPRPYDGPESR